MSLTRLACAIAYDANGNFALGVATKTSLGVAKLVDSGLSAPLSATARAATLTDLAAQGYLTTSNSYASGLLAHAQADAVTLAGSL